MDEQPTLKELFDRKAGCFELAWYGYIRMYDDSEERCQCHDCLALDKLADDLFKLHQKNKSHKHK